MKPTILTAPNLEMGHRPVLFLAGPIVGARRWQDEVIATAPEGDYIIANPRREIDRMEDFNEDLYRVQVEWESTYLHRAGEDGVILFWLAREEKHDCTRAYAQTTRFELGEWSGRSGNIVVGIEDGFPGGRYIRERLVHVHSTLQETVAAAFKKLSWSGRRRLDSDHSSSSEE